MFSKMEFALISLLSVVVISNQQFYEQSTDEKLLWLMSYYSPQLAVSKYNYQPFNHHNSDSGNYHLRPSSGSSMNSQQPHFRTVQNPKRLHENQLLDVQLRNKLGNSRYWPSFLEQLKPQFNPRIVINLANRTNLLTKVKTITFTFTSSLTFTSVQSCIPSTDFSPGFNAVACRKRRGLVESSDLGTSQFTITTSDVQPMEPTVLSWLDPSVENRQSGNDPTVNANVVSSKDDGTLDEWQSVTLKPLGHYSRDKRLYLHFVTTKTVISYTSLSTTLTKTVNLLNPFFGAGQLVCLPQGYAVCPNNATSFPR